MNTQTVHFVVEFTIHEGHLDAFEAIARRMVASSQQEAGTLGYEWYLSRDRRHCHLLETYRDANAVLAHVTGSAISELPNLLQHGTLARFSVYGDPGSEAAGPLAKAGAEIFDAWQGLER